MAKRVLIIGGGNVFDKINPIDLITMEIPHVIHPLRFEDNSPEVLENIKQSWLSHCSSDAADINGKMPLVKFLISEIEKNIK